MYKIYIWLICWLVKRAGNWRDAGQGEHEYMQHRVLFEVRNTLKRR